MPRVIFELPESFTFSTELQIYISHVNQGGHLDNAQLLTLVSEARVRYFQSLGYAEADVGDVSIVVADMIAQYSSEAFHGETLRVEMAPADFNRHGFDLQYRMTEKTSGRGVAKGKVGIVFIDKHSRSVAPFPEAIRKLIVAS